MEYRKEQERQHFEMMKSSVDPFHGLMTIEVNATELCNRTCVFCPRHDPEVYPNQHLHMSPENAMKIAKNIAQSRYFGRISFSGFGENLMYKKFPSVVREFRKELPDNIIECNTNGDILLKRDGLATELYESGLSFLYINMYDGEWQRDEFLEVLDREKIPSSWYTFRKHWIDDDHGLVLNNRSGVIKWVDADTESLVRTPCYYPSYKMLVDWNGNVLFCSNDWGRKHIVGNLLHHKIKDVWLGDKMVGFRKTLGAGVRINDPCKDCSVKGDLFGKASYDHFYKCEGVR